MARLRGSRMGEVKVEVELENAGDRVLARYGHIAEDQVRSARVRVLADSGARMLMLPQELVESLGLLEVRRARVTYADERTEERPIAEAITIRVGNRSTLVQCIVGPRGSEPLLGQIELEAMDLLVDCAGQCLVPRSESPDLPLIPIKQLAPRTT